MKQTESLSTSEPVVNDSKLILSVMLAGGFRVDMIKPYNASKIGDIEIDNVFHNFLNWYHHSTQSNEYVFKENGTRTIIIRQHICAISIKPFVPRIIPV